MWSVIVSGSNILTPQDYQKSRRKPKNRKNPLKSHSSKTEREVERYNFRNLTEHGNNFKS